MFIETLYLGNNQSDDFLGPGEALSSRLEQLRFETVAFFLPALVFFFVLRVQSCALPFDFGGDLFVAFARCGESVHRFLDRSLFANPIAFGLSVGAFAVLGFFFLARATGCAQIDH